jgi:hypothetical protein
MKSELEHLIVFRRKSDLSAIGDPLVPCMGICCAEHGSCAHYEAVNGSDPTGLRWSHCPLKSDGSRALYVPLGGVERRTE